MGATERLWRTWSEMQRTDEDEGAGIRLEIRDALRVPRHHPGHAPRRRISCELFAFVLSRLSIFGRKSCSLKDKALFSL